MARGGARAEQSDPPRCRVHHGGESTAYFKRADLLEWFKSMHGAQIVWGTKGMHLAAVNDRFEAVKWLHENATPAAFRTQQKILLAAVKGENILKAAWVCQLASLDTKVKRSRVVLSWLSATTFRSC